MAFQVPDENKHVVPRFADVFERTNPNRSSIVKRVLVTLQSDSSGPIIFLSKVVKQGPDVLKRLGSRRFESNVIGMVERPLRETQMGLFGLHYQGRGLVDVHPPVVTQYESRSYVFHPGDTDATYVS